MKSTEIKREREFTLTLNEREAGILKNLIGEVTGSCETIGNAYDILNGLGIEDAGHFVCKDSNPQMWDCEEDYDAHCKRYGLKK